MFIETGFVSKRSAPLGAGDCFVEAKIYKLAATRRRGLADVYLIKMGLPTREKKIAATFYSRGKILMQVESCLPA